MKNYVTVAPFLFYDLTYEFLLTKSILLYSLAMVYAGRMTTVYGALLLILLPYLRWKHESNSLHLTGGYSQTLVIFVPDAWITCCRDRAASSDDI